MRFPIKQKNCVFYKFFNFLLFLGVKYTRKKFLKIKELNFSIVTKTCLKLANNLQIAHIRKILRIWVKKQLFFCIVFQPIFEELFVYITDSTLLILPYLFLTQQQKNTEKNDWENFRNFFYLTGKSKK